MIRTISRFKIPWAIVTEAPLQKLGFLTGYRNGTGQRHGILPKRVPLGVWSYRLNIEILSVV